MGHAHGLGKGMIPSAGKMAAVGIDAICEILPAEFLLNDLSRFRGDARRPKGIDHDQTLL